MFLTTRQLATLLERCPPDSGVYFTSESEGAPAEEAVTPSEITVSHWVGGFSEDTGGDDPHRLSPLETGEVREVHLTIEHDGRIRQPA